MMMVIVKKSERERKKNKGEVDSLDAIATTVYMLLLSPHSHGTNFCIRSKGVGKNNNKSKQEAHSSFLFDLEVQVIQI